MSVLLGDTYPAELISVADLTAATVTCQVTAPDGTTTAYSGGSITVSGETASTSIPASQVGTWLIVWTTTGTVAGVVQDQFTVEAAALDLMSLPDLRDELNLADAYTIEDAELRRSLRAARGVVENITGPIVPTPKTIWVDGGGTYFVLPYQWVVSVTSIIEWTGATSYTLTEQPYGTTPDGYGYTWDRDTGIVTRRGYGANPQPFASGYGNVAVSFIAGMATIPADIQQATARLIEHWWRKQNNAWRAGGMFTGTPADDAGTSMVGNYEVPNAAMELLEPYRRLPGMA